MRIVGGKFRGRALVAPADHTIRPTSDRVREALFNILMHGPLGERIASCRVIDLFAGTGALGFEAISRGAAYCLFVEQSAESRGLIRETVETLQLTGCTRIFRRDATTLGEAGTMGRFGLAFLDPPYGKGLADRALVALLSGHWLEPEALVVIEERMGVAVVLPPELTLIDLRTYGDTQVLILQNGPARSV
jgi:16S rRNA (guanine966-N2)-methyltransferase